ncbi:hypothetical protein [Polyangium sp. 6x1]|uniref:hypothetical protein n=1 Tax=Polyangium sp. 6x1 TaxID=3042689 RepID=UPI00248282A2|nr:hypothetical protein [Polyangium sp. 6x1]MDI1443925.1 hypothetical protein [Polyangium sp. 6x1]
MNRTRNARLALLASASCMIVAALGCSGKSAGGGGGAGGEGGEGGGGGSGPGMNVCKESDFTPWAVDVRDGFSLSTSKKGVTALLSTDAGLEFVRAGGERVLLAPKASEQTGFQGKHFSRSDGTVCAVFVDSSVSTSTMQFVCDDGKGPTDTMIEPGSDLYNDYHLAPIEGQYPGETNVYGMEHAAITLFVGSENGWSAQELYESSISYAGNAVRRGNEVIACVIGSGYVPMLANYNQEDWGVEQGTTAYDCRVATDGTSLFVAADNRFATLTNFNGGAFTTTPVPGLTENDYVLSLAAYKGKAWGLTSHHKLIDPTTGTPDPWTIPEGSRADMIIDPASGALTIGVLQGDGQYVVGTKCLP